MARIELPLLRTSTRLAYRRCPQRWQWGIEEGLEPKIPGLGPLWFGTGIHLCLAEWYKPGRKRGVHPAKTWKKYCTDEYNWIRTGEWGIDEDEYVSAKHLGTAMMEGYVDEYGRDHDWDVIQPERIGRVKIPHPNLPGKFLMTYVFTIDLVYRCRVCGKIKLGEHKTAAQINTRHLGMDDQAGSYLTAGTTLLRGEGLLQPDEQIEEITYNFMRKALPETDPRPRNKAGEFLNADGSVSKRQSTKAPLFVRETIPRSRASRANQIKRIQKEWAAMEMFRSGELDVYKNPTKDCSWDCNFFDMCGLHEDGGDWETLRDATMKVRDPNEPYRKAA